MASCEIKRLDLNSIRPNGESVKTNLGGSKITIIGKPGTGKSTLIKQLLYSKRDLIPVGVVFSGSEESNNFYSKIFPQLFIYSKYEKNVIESLKERQKLAKQFCHDSWAVLIMDDCMDDTKIFSDVIMVDLFKNSRHWNLLSIFANQYVLDFKPALRSSIDGVFIFREPILINREKIYKNFASIIPSYRQFSELMDKYTNDYSCLYIDNQGQTNDWTKCVFQYKADLVPDFEFGCEDYRLFAKERQRDEEEYF